MPKSDAAWLYQVPEEYEALLGADGADESWYLELVRPGDTVLDLGCGCGRLSVPLALAGAKVCGLDNSPAMLARAQAKSQAAGVAVDWRLGDWTRLELGRTFDVAILPYNGLQHLLSLEQLKAFLTGVQRHLAPGALFGLDLHVPQVALLARDPEEWFGVQEGPLSPGGWKVLAEQSRWDPASQVLTQRWQLGSAAGESRIMELPLRQYFPLDLRALLEAGGFELMRQDHGFSGEPLRPTSLRQALLLRRP